MTFRWPRSSNTLCATCTACLNFFVVGVAPHGRTCSRFDWTICWWHRGRERKVWYGSRNYVAWAYDDAFGWPPNSGGGLDLRLALRPSYTLGCSVVWRGRPAATARHVIWYVRGRPMRMSRSWAEARGFSWGINCFGCGHQAFRGAQRENTSYSKKKKERKKIPRPTINVISIVVGFCVGLH
jgi:hypothetical protein